MKYKYVFDNYFYYGSFPNEDFLNCSLISTKDVKEGIVYFNSENDKTLWLLKYEKDINKLKKSIEKCVDVTNKMSLQLSKIFDKRFIDIMTKTAY